MPADLARLALAVPLAPTTCTRIGGLMVTSSVTSTDQRPPDLRESGTSILTSYGLGNRRSGIPSMPLTCMNARTGTRLRAV